MKLTLISKENLIDNVWSFKFEAHPAQRWTAGQYIQIELPHSHPDAEGTKRYFTVSAAPFEEHIQITTRITESSFKQALVNLPVVGGELKLLMAPDGDFVWEETEQPKVFVAAGIGITPYRSMLAQRAHDRLPLDVTLVYANRTDKAAFREEFDRHAAAGSGFKVHYLTGLVTEGGLRELLPDLMESLIYVSGPEPLVETLGDTLRAAGLPETQIKQDFFPNYTAKNF
jgi:ferredoxin-NADP reductase